MKNSEPKSERIHIGFIGRCNSGKSSLINALAGQQVSIVSDIAGTTTDVITKVMELPEVGASVLIDTAGIDDTTELSLQRIDSTRKILSKIDIAVLLFNNEDISVELKWFEQLRQLGISVIVVVSKSDAVRNIDSLENSIIKSTLQKPIRISAVTKQGHEKLFRAISQNITDESRLITDSVCHSGDMVLLVMPQDEQAPKGRLIKPQVEVLRELLDRGCIAMCCTAKDMEQALASMSRAPELIITDSQVFKQVYALKPAESLLTSFSVLFARYKGDITEFVSGAKAIQKLSPESHILIAEACTHVPQNEDIGRVKLPRLLRQRIGEGVNIKVVSGNDFPKDLSCYDLVIHCGACMFTRHHVMSRVMQAQSQHIPITNYGVAIAALTGILDSVSY